MKIDSQKDVRDLAISVTLKSLHDEIDRLQTQVAFQEAQLKLLSPAAPVPSPSDTEENPGEVEWGKRTALVKIGGTVKRSFIDSGGEVSAITYEHYEENMGEITPVSNLVMEGVGGKWIRIMGVIDTTMTNVRGHQISSKLYVIKNEGNFFGNSPTIGDEDAQKLGINRFDPRGTMPKKYRGFFGSLRKIWNRMRRKL